MTNEVADPVRDRAHWQFSSSSCYIFHGRGANDKMIEKMKSQLVRGPTVIQTVTVNKWGP